MNLRASIACLGLAAALAARAHAAECNDWPIRVAHTDARSAAQSTQCIGPLFFSQPLAAGDHAEGFRPFYLHRQNADASSETDFLYPLFFRRDYADGYRWSILNLINRDQPAAGQAARTTRGFDLWPFYFSRQTGKFLRISSRIFCASTWKTVEVVRPQPGQAATTGMNWRKPRT